MLHQPSTRGPESRLGPRTFVCAILTTAALLVVTTGLLAAVMLSLFGIQRHRRPPRTTGR